MDTLIYHSPHFIICVYMYKIIALYIFFFKIFWLSSKVTPPDMNEKDEIISIL